MSPLEAEQHDGFQIITMHWNGDRPGFDLAAFREATNLIKRADHDPDIAATIFRGAGGIYCLGGDVRAFVEANDVDALAAGADEFISALIRSRKPLIASIDGKAMGIGMTMLFHFDVVLATPESTFQAPFVDWGLVPEAAATLIGPETMGHRAAFDIFCLGRELSAACAEAKGVVTRVLPSAQLEAEALTIARRLATSPRPSLLKTRELMRGSGTRLVNRAKTETTLFRGLMQERSTLRRLRIMAHALKRAFPA